MKKIICFVLVAVLLSLSAMPALAQEADGRTYVEANGLSKIPIVLISGDGDPLYDTEGNRVLYYKEIINGTADMGEADDENIKQSILNVVYPFLVEGMLTNKWENYYAALQQEISELFGDSLLDKNGEATNGVDISQANYDKNARNMATDKQHNGYYFFNDYYFFYDWRLDPLETADKLNEYIKAVKAVTKSDKVGLLSRCLGTSVAAAYVAKYGLDDVTGVGFDGGVVNGSEVISQSISGKFKLDASALNRFLCDCNALGFFNIDSFITASVDLLDKNGMFDTAVGITKATIYYKVLEGVTSALALSTFFTWPSYWAAVTAEDYDDAMQYVFGAEGSEKRTEYAGLISKIDNYNTTIRKNLPSIFKTISDEGNICVISKYGYQIGPICDDCDEVSDQFASVYRSSYGATTSKVYNTLDDKYIERRIYEGRGKYISPDKQIDATTCLFPDNTWVVKGASHSKWTSIEHGILMATISADRQLTPDDFIYSQFMVWDYETNTMSAMTEENCNTYSWEATEDVYVQKNIFEKIKAYFISLFNWFKEAFHFLEEKRAEE